MVLRMNLSWKNTSFSPTCSSNRNCSIRNEEIYVGVHLYHAVVILSFLLIFPIHAWLIWLRLPHDWRTTPVQFLGLNINVLEVIFCTEGVLYALNYYILENDWMSMALTMLFGLAWLGRPLLHTWTCVEIFTAVVYPTKYRQFRALQYRIGILGAVWATCLCYSLYLELLAVDYVEDPVILAVLCCCAAVISCCSVSMLWKLRQPGPSTGQRVGQDRQKQRAFTTISKHLGFLLLTYTPLLLMNSVAFQLDGSVQFCCNVLFGMNAISVFGVIVMSMHMLFKDGNLPCFKGPTDTPR